MSARQLDDSSVETLTALVDETRRLVSQVYGDSVLFEHGAVRPNSAVGCGVDHAHIHVVPLASAGLLDDVKAACPLLHWTSAPSISDLAQLVPIGTPYLWLSTAEGADVGFGAEIGSQVVRRVIARRLGITHQYDWRAFPHEPTALATIRNLRRPRASELVATAA